MPLKIKNLKFIIKSYVLGFLFLTTLSSFSQEIIDETVELQAPKVATIDSVTDVVQRVKIDGVAAVIGDCVGESSDTTSSYGVVIAVTATPTVRPDCIAAADASRIILDATV